jgi:hypothetical protein
MAAIALAESGGNTEAHNGKPPDDSYGLWQINMLGAMGPARRKKFGIKDNKALFDPDINAKAALIIYREQGLKAWTTYTSGKYKQFMDDAAGSPTMTTTSDGNPITGAFNAFGDTLLKAASNFVGIIIAAVFLIVGVVLLARNVVPAGKVLKTVKKVTG